MNLIKRFAALMLTACMLLSAVPVLADGAVLYKKGSKGSEVQAIKDRMFELGYYTARGSNEFNDIMTERVMQLQQMNGLPQTGVIDEDLYELIFADYVIRKDGTTAVPGAAAPSAEERQAAADQPAAATPEPAQPQAEAVLYREGDSGSDIQKIKQRLFELGFYSTLPSNNAYNATMSERLAQLYKANGSSGDGTTITQAQYDLIFSKNVKDGSGNIAGTLKQGDSNARVRDVRQRMYELAYFDSAGGSEFTAAMTERVKLLQKMNGYKETGVITPDFYNYIMSDKCTRCGEHINPSWNAANRYYYNLDGEKLYSLSESGNVVIFIVDYFANNYLNSAIWNHLDALGAFNDFTYYDNCDCSYIGTYPSITHMLTGNSFDPSLLVGQYFEQSWTSETAEYIFNTIHEKGWEFRYYYYTSISDGAMSWAMGKLDNLLDYKTDPSRAAQPIYSYTDFYDNLKAKGLTVDKTDKGYIQMIHMRGAHGPYSAAADGSYKADANRTENICGYMTMIADYIQRMKNLDLYDDATIIITADHGDKQGNMQVVYWIKQAGEHHDRMLETDAPISHDDFPGTILSVIGADYPYGDSIFDWQSGEIRQRSCGQVGRDTTNYPLVTSYSDLEMGAHNIWETYTYEGDGTDLMKAFKRGRPYVEFLAQSFN